MAKFLMVATFAALGGMNLAFVLVGNCQFLSLAASLMCSLIVAWAILNKE